MWEVHQALPDVCVVGVGGVRTGYDALELLLAGASAVQVGTMIFHDPSSPARIVAELEAELSQRNFTRVADVVGRPTDPKGNCHDVRCPAPRGDGQPRAPVCGDRPAPRLMDSWGMTDGAVGLERFSMSAVEALAGAAAAVKPQSAFFERHGAKGIAVLEKVIGAARDLGMVVLDVKRGDIGSTAQAYADAYLDPPHRWPWTRSPPARSSASLAAPMIETARAHGAGVFVLALTSNPEGPEVQHARTADGRTVAGTVLDSVASLNADEDGWLLRRGGGRDDRRDPENLDVNGPLLVPGIGAQGGTADDVRRIFGPAVRNVLASSSREILAAGPDPSVLRATALEAARSFAALADVGCLA